MLGAAPVTLGAPYFEFHPICGQILAAAARVCKRFRGTAHVTSQQCRIESVRSKLATGNTRRLRGVLFSAISPACRMVYDTPDKTLTTLQNRWKTAKAATQHRARQRIFRRICSAAETPGRGCPRLFGRQA